MVCSELTSTAEKMWPPQTLEGFPYAPFVDKVEDYVSSRGEVETTLKSFQEMISYVTGAEGVRCRLTRRPGNTSLWRQTCNGER